MNRSYYCSSSSSDFAQDALHVLLPPTGEERERGRGRNGRFASHTVIINT